MCDASNHKSYGSGLKAFNEVSKRTFSILGNVIIFLPMVLRSFGPWISDATDKCQSGLWKCFPLLLPHIRYKYIHTA